MASDIRRKHAYAAGIGICAICSFSAFFVFVLFRSLRGGSTGRLSPLCKHVFDAVDCSRAGTANCSAHIIFLETICLCGGAHNIRCANRLSPRNNSSSPLLATIKFGTGRETVGEECIGRLSTPCPDKLKSIFTLEQYHRLAILYDTL